MSGFFHHCIHDVCGFFCFFVLLSLFQKAVDYGVELCFVVWGFFWFFFPIFVIMPLKISVYLAENKVQLASCF